jgi:hypothetical protein
MLHVYDLRVDVGTGKASRFSAALRVLNSLKSMTLIRIGACTRASFLDTHRSSHDGLFGVVTRFTGWPERCEHSRRSETLAASAPQQLQSCCAAAVPTSHLEAWAPPAPYAVAPLKLSDMVRQ